jgi:hypothetical protein
MVSSDTTLRSSVCSVVVSPSTLWAGLPHAALFSFRKLCLRKARPRPGATIGQRYKIGRYRRLPLSLLPKRNYFVLRAGSKERPELFHDRLFFVIRKELVNPHIILDLIQECNHLLRLFEVQLARV